MAATCDERSLRAWLASPVQIIALALLAWGVVALARVLAPARPWVAPIALAWTMLSPGTTCAAWQIDAGSQTWSAALGIWACVLCWRCIAAARVGRVDARSLLLLTATFALGVNIKETFYGWSAGIGLACLGATAWLLMRDRASAWRASLVLWPVIALPVAHLAARWIAGAMSHSMDASGESRYQLELGMNLFVNAAQSLAGSIGTGPFYLITDGQAPIALRALPALAGLAEFVLLLAAPLTKHIPLAALSAVLVVVAGGAFWLVRRYRRDEGLRRRWQGRLLRVPLWGRGAGILASLRFARTLAMLLRGGVALVDAVPLAGRASGNAWVAMQTMEGGATVRHGGRLSQAVSTIGPLGEHLAGWIQIGEESADMAGMLEHAAGRCAENWNRFVSRGLALLEPALLLVIGVFVLIVTLAVLLPVLTLTRSMTS